MIHHPADGRHRVGVNALHAQIGRKRASGCARPTPPSPALETSALAGLRRPDPTRAGGGELISRVWESFPSCVPVPDQARSSGSSSVQDGNRRSRVVGAIPFSREPTLPRAAPGGKGEVASSRSERDVPSFAPGPSGHRLSRNVRSMANAARASLGLLATAAYRCSVDRYRELYAGPANGLRESAVGRVQTSTKDHRRRSGEAVG